MFAIAPERAEDSPQIESLLNKAFGPKRLDLTAYRLRENVPPCAGFSFCARLEGRLAGSIRFWPIKIGSAPGLLLGPLAVDPDFQGKGAGRALIAHGCAATDKAGHPLTLLVGDLDYYASSGFVRVPSDRAQMPGPVDTTRVLWRKSGGGPPPGDISGLIAKAPPKKAKQCEHNFRTTFLRRVAGAGFSGGFREKEIPAAGREMESALLR